MPADYTKMCRVCRGSGSRDIFSKSMNESPDAPLDRLLEKLRYVTLLTIDEKDNLPRYLCDLCIVQLNVAYNFKTLSVKNDSKWKQIYIENGISNTTEENFAIASTSSSPAVLENDSKRLEFRMPYGQASIKTETIDCDSCESDSSNSVVAFQNPPPNGFFQNDRNTVMVYINENSQLVPPVKSSTEISKAYCIAKSNRPKAPISLKKKKNLVRALACRSVTSRLQKKKNNLFSRKSREIDNLKIDMTIPVGSPSENLTEAAPSIIKGNKELRYKEKYASQLQMRDVQRKARSLEMQNVGSSTKAVTSRSSYDQLNENRVALRRKSRSLDLEDEKPGSTFMTSTPHVTIEDRAKARKKSRNLDAGDERLNSAKQTSFTLARYNKAMVDIANERKRNRINLEVEETRESSRSATKFETPVEKLSPRRKTLSDPKPTKHVTFNDSTEQAYLIEDEDGFYSILKEIPKKDEDECTMQK